MARMKGITPIISTIVLVLVMVALAGAAWSYIGGFTSSYTSKVIDLPPGSSYFDGKNVNIMLRNIGTSAISTGSCTVSGSNNNTVTCGDITITREGSSNDADIRPSAASISPKGSITITDYNCQAGNVRYRISSPSSTYDVNVNADMPCSYPADPVSWWKFEGDAKDSIGGNDGTPNGGVDLNYNDAARGKVASFDGVDDYISATPPVGGMTQGTMAYWVKLNNLATIQTPMGIGNAGPGKWRIDVYTNGQAVADFWLDGNAASAVGVITAGVFYHLVATFDGTTKRMYVNGVQVASAVSAATSVNALTAQISGYQPGGYIVNGLIDDVMIFKRALSPEEIKAVYNSQKK